MSGYENPEDLVTGAYDDNILTDERLWASAELLAATGDSKYLDAVKQIFDEDKYKTGFGWADVVRLAQAMQNTQNMLRRCVIISSV